MMWGGGWGGEVGLEEQKQNTENNLMSGGKK